MDDSRIVCRRATIDDLADLQAFWIEAGTPKGAPEKRVAEFQIARIDDHSIIGALALQIAGKAGRVHSAVFSSAEAERALWSRVLDVAESADVYVLWAQDDVGSSENRKFEDATPEALKSRPAAFPANDIPWKTLELKKPPEELISIESQLEMFQEQQRMETSRTLKKAGCFKIFAYILLIFAVTGAIVFIVMMVQSGFNNRVPITGAPAETTGPPAIPGPSPTPPQDPAAPPPRPPSPNEPAPGPVDPKPTPDSTEQ